MEKIKFFDAHFHIIDPSFPIFPNQGYLPNSYLSKDYFNETKEYLKKGGAIVSGSFQEYDQGYLIKALKSMGTSYCGVTQLPHTISDEVLSELNIKGVRGVRFNCKRGGSEKIEHLVKFANRIYDLLKWHVELYIESKDLKSLLPLLEKCPKVSIDHLGLTKVGFEDLLYLVREGVKVKATGFSRLDFSPEEALEKIHTKDPKALLFGTDLPSTRAPKRFSHEDLELIQRLFGDEDQKKILYKNALDFYRL